MKLEINENNLKEYINHLSLNKKNNLIICIPTFNSFEITCKTIESFIKQKDVKFDLLIIGPSGDIEKIKEKYSNVNFCITKGNYGSSGNQLINIFIAKKFEYPFFVLNDNDAVLLDELGLSKMLEKMKEENLVWVTPVLNHCKLSQMGNYLATIFHCCLFSREIYDKLDYFFNPNYFLLFDDVSFAKRLEYNFPGRIKAINVKYYHPIKLHVISFDIKYVFLCTRSILIYIIREKFPLRYKLSLNYLRPCISILLIFLIKHGFKFVQIFIKSLFQVLRDDYNLDYYKKLENKIKFQEISLEEAKKIEKIHEFKLIDNPVHTIIIPKRFKFMDADFSYKYFVRNF